MNTTPISSNASKQQDYMGAESTSSFGTQTDKKTRLYFARTRQAKESRSIASSTDRGRGGSTRECDKKKITEPLPTGPAQAPSRQRKGKSRGR